MTGFSIVCANAVIRLAYGAAALANPSRPLLGKVPLAPDTEQFPEARSFVCGLAAHQVAVALLGLASLGRHDLRRPAMALAAATDVADIASAAIEARSRSRLDSDLSGGIAFSSAGLASALVGWRLTWFAREPQRGIRSSGKPIKMVDHAQGWQGLQALGRRRSVYQAEISFARTRVGRAHGTEPHTRR